MQDFRGGRGMSQGTTFQEEGVFMEVHEVCMEVHGGCIGWMESLERMF